MGFLIIALFASLLVAWYFIFNYSVTEETLVVPSSIHLVLCAKNKTATLFYQSSETGLLHCASFDLDIAVLHQSKEFNTEPVLRIQTNGVYTIQAVTMDFPEHITIDYRP